jgi:hypothetical protein
MLRAGRDADGQWYVGRGNGRGVWWCRETECGAALRVGHLARALRTPVMAGDLKVLLTLCQPGR